MHPVYSRRGVDPFPVVVTRVGIVHWETGVSSKWPRGRMFNCLKTNLQSKAESKRWQKGDRERLGRVQHSRVVQPVPDNEQGPNDVNKQCWVDAGDGHGSGTEGYNNQWALGPLGVRRTDWQTGKKRRFHWRRLDCRPWKEEGRSDVVQDATRARLWVQHVIFCRLHYEMKKCAVGIGHNGVNLIPHVILLRSSRGLRAVVKHGCVGDSQRWYCITCF
ncbi:hypothetical protein CPC08DRAFT_725115 [Agrocybe pediades]|nr:hypothetical protein CPC08DRAFT_725115 [Agrocybe pediades]